MGRPWRRGYEALAIAEARLTERPLTRCGRRERALASAESLDGIPVCKQCSSEIGLSLA